MSTMAVVVTKKWAVMAPWQGSAMVDQPVIGSLGGVQLGFAASCLYLRSRVPLRGRHGGCARVLALSATGACGRRSGAQGPCTLGTAFCGRTSRPIICGDGA